MSWSFKADCLKKGVMLYMNEYEKYQLQWLMEHGYSLADFVKALIPHVNEVSSIEPDANLAYCLKEGFYDFKNEGFNGDIWLSEEEWKQDLNRGNEYNLTNDGMSKVKLFIEQCKVKQESILKAGLDTAKETTLPSVEDIICNVEDMVDNNGEYTNAWSISDNYLSDPLELHKDEDFVIISNERTKDNVVQLPLEDKETPIQSHEVSTPHPHYTEVNLFDVSDDVFHEEDTQNSFSYAEVKAIASGNPIIKEKFEVDNEVKRLETMRRSWQKKKLQAQDYVALLPDRIETEKKYRTILAKECEYFRDEIEANNLRDTEHFTFYDVKGNEYHDLKVAWDVIQECTKGYKLHDFKENKFVGRFMKADVLIGLGLAGEGIVIKMKTPLRTINVDSVNPVGRVNFNRMYKRINDIRYSLNKTIETIQNYEGNLKIAKEMVNKPFELQDELTNARNRQKEINKILDTSGNENSKVVVEDDLEEERNESGMEL